MFYELREYRIKENYGDEFAEIMESIIIPFQKEMGMNIIGSFRVEDDKDLYVWIRRFKNEKEQKDLYDKVYGSRYWEEIIRPKMGDMVIKHEKNIYILKPTPNSDLN